MSAAEIAESHPAHVRLLVEGHGLRGHAGNRRNARRTVKALINAAKKLAKADAPITPHYETDEPWGRFGWVDEDVKWFKIVKD